MDWTKAKTILIVALLLTNIFLIFTYASANKSEEVAIQEAELIALLESKDIWVETEIPTRHPALEALTIVRAEFSQEEAEALVASVDPVPRGASQDDYVQAVKEFFGYLGFTAEHLAFTHMEQEGETTTLFCNTRVNGIDVAGSEMKCIFAGDRIRQIEGNRFWPQEISKKKLATSSATEALLAFFSERGSDERMVITEIRLVYWIGDEYNESNNYLSVTALPAWEITYNKGKTAYIDAFRG